MKPRLANEARQEAALHRAHDRQLDHKHAELHHHAAHYKGHVFRHPRVPPRPPRPPQLTRRPQPQRVQQAAQPQTDIDNDIQDEQRQREESERSIRAIQMSMAMQDDSADMGQNQGEPDARAAHHKWLQACVPAGKPGPRHGDGLQHDDSPEAQLLRRAGAQPGTVAPKDCADALARALVRNVVGAGQAGGAGAPRQAARALHALELGSAYLRSGADAELFGNLRQVRDALLRAREGQPARSPTPPDEAQQNRNLLLPLVLLALGRPRTPQQTDAALARRANAAASLHAAAAPGPRP